MREELSLKSPVVSGTIPPGLDGLYLKMGANPVRQTTRGHDGSSATAWSTASRSRRAGIVVPQPVDRLAQGGRCARTAGRTRAAAGWQRHRQHPSSGSAAGSSRSSRPAASRRAFAEPRGTALQSVRGTLAGSFTGHPHLDPLTGETHAIAYDGGSGTACATSSSRQRAGRAGRARCGRARALHPRLRDHGALCDRARPAGHVLLQGIARRLPLPVPLEPRPWGRVGLLPRQGGEPTSCGARSSPASCSTWPTPTTTPGRVILDVVAYDTVFSAAAGGSTPGQARALGRSIPRRCGSHGGARRDPTGIPASTSAVSGSATASSTRSACPPTATRSLPGQRSSTGTISRRASAGARVRSRPDPGGVHLRAGTSRGGEDEGWLVGFVMTPRATRRTSPSSTRARSRRRPSLRFISATASRLASTATGFRHWRRGSAPTTPLSDRCDRGS